MKNITIRAAIDGDIPKLVSLRKLYLSEKYGKIENTETLTIEIEKYFHRHLNNDIDIVIAEYNNDIIAAFCTCYVVLLPCIDSSKEKSGYLIFNYIKQMYRDEDLRNALLYKSIEIAKDRKATIFELEVPEEEFEDYSKLGFSKLPVPLVRHYINTTKHINVNNEHIIFRKATISDSSKLADIRVQFLDELSRKNSIKDKNAFTKRIDLFIQNNLGNGLEAFIAENEKGIISACFVLYFERVPDINLSNARYGLLTNCYTNPEFRGKGIAKDLFEFTSEYSINQGFKLFEMTIAESSMKFCNSLGFNKIEIVPLQKEI